MKRESILSGVVAVLVLSLALPMAALADYIDTTGPTGHYYQYAGFTKTATSVYKGGGDVDSYGDLIYVNRDGTNLDVYQVTLLDSDGDGVLEPDQHPLNIGPDEIAGTADDQIGPMEQRVLTHVTTYSVPDLYTATVGEIYAASDRVYFLGTDRGDIYEYVFATGVTSKVVDGVLPTGHYNLSHLGYDDINNEWYASSENMRAVYKWDGSSWVQQFTFSSLGGGHMDGLEVITDPSTGIPYVYVSDMTSDYIGQWRYDSTTSSWVEENLFTYAGAYGNVEGMGFGALGHIWVTTGFSGSGTLYELGGGKLGAYIPAEQFLEKEITSGPDVDGDGVIDVVVEVGQTQSTEYDFTITQSGLGGLLIVDTVPAEWEVLSAESDNPDDEVDVFPANRRNPSKSATKIEWRPASGSSSLLVWVETRQSPGKRNIKFRPTSCGALYLNEDGAEAYELDPETGEPLRDPDTGEKLPPILVSNPLCLAAVEDLDGGGIVGDGSGDEDGDGLTDFEEACVIGTSPCNPDTDGDGVPDGSDPDPLDPGVF